MANNLPVAGDETLKSTKGALALRQLNTLPGSQPSSTHGFGAACSGWCK
jgi:hypothetical protein